MTCNLPRKILPLNGSSFVCENVVEQSFEGLTAGAEYILNVWGANDVGEKKLKHFTFRVPSPPRNKSKCFFFLNECATNKYCHIIFT